uniref:Uncharacterized protein n=1 Tax=Rhizophora mucronata TaxID=61149 RepID=A0A2P2QKN0_RHIMU
MTSCQSSIHHTGLAMVILIEVLLSST